MAAKGYQYYEVDAFPEWGIGSPPFETIHQDTLFREWVDEYPRTVITATGSADHRDFLKFHVMHESTEKVRGRYINGPIHRYIAQNEFYIYYHPKLKRMFVDTSRPQCGEMIDRLGRCEIDFLVIPRKVDLIQLGIDLKESIRGGWFGELKVADVSTIGIFSPTVGESSEWDRFEQMGRLKAIDLSLEFGDHKTPVKITQNRGIVLFETFPESEALRWLLELQSVLDSYIIHE